MTYDSENIFAKILANEIPSVKLFENEFCIAIMDAFPQSKGHSLVIPRAKSRNLLDADAASVQQTIPYVQTLAIAAKSALNADGIRIAQFNEAPAGQTVFHLHWHVIPVYENASEAAHASGMAEQSELESIAQKIRANL